MQDRVESRLWDVARLAGVAAICFVCGELGFMPSFTSPIRSPVWPPMGIALAILLVRGLKVWPGVLIGFFALAWANWPLPQSGFWTALPACAALALGSTVQATAAAWLVNCFAAGRLALGQPRSLFLFVLFAAVIAPAFGAISSVAVHVLAGITSREHAGYLWFLAWLSGMNSVVLLTPLCLAWYGTPLPEWNIKRSIEAAALLGLLVVLCGIGFGGWLAAPTRGAPLAFTIVPVLLWAAMRFGQRGTATAAFLAAAFATLGTSHGQGAFALPDRNASLLHLQNFFVVSTIMSLVLAADVVQRKGMAEGLRASERELRRRVEELQTLFDAAPVGIAVAHDPECRSITGNPACSGFLSSNGSPPSSQDAKTAHSGLKILRNGKEIAADQMPMQLAARDGVAIPGQELDVCLPDGRILSSYASASPLYDDTGRIRGSLGIFVDMTSKRHAEQEVLRLNAELERRVAERTSQLEALNKELEAFSYSVSHDLRTPLRSIRGFSEVLIHRYSTKMDDRGKDFLQRICAASQHMDDLVDDLLKLSRVGRAELVSQQVNLSALAESLAASLCQAEPKRSVRFILKPGLHARGDPRLLRIMLENLFNNAWKFTRQQSQSRIEFGTVSHPYQAFFISDNGAGFDMSYANRLFGVFQRLHSAADFPGTGIGLATVQRIINRHGGRIWAEGALGQGATFYFSLPAAELKTSPSTDAVINV